ncbi:hypothetical protein SAMN05892883_1778 [Jatrophihabitans sp. GAS493]|uniref:hypothetical protein n=1 Tax=Jatrophihabitans sp. GAS493 TaxID=1907575 RepID=UPI000BBF805F|nr:hypothetical protein [Jatrophihabitans sp. GAS493]SOD72379.1 hypothetical protein SAMN05892883_1778 [Jatrophihabitans sp. GAS493]
MSREHRGYAAWIVLVVAGTLSIVLAALLVFQLTRPTKYHIAANEQAAMDAASQATVNLGSLSRKNFDADWARAVKGVSGPTLDALQPLKANTQQTMVAAQSDLVATVSSTSVESSNKDTVMVLIAFNGYKVDDKGTKTQSSANRLELTMKQTGGKWLINDTKSLGLTS